MERLYLKKQPLDLDYTLGCGQAFRWRKRPGGLWSGVVRDKLVELAVEDGFLLWQTYPESDRALVEDYLRLSDDVNSVYASLSAADPHVAGAIRKFHGLRPLRQDPTETLLSFVCSAANSIPRIMDSVEELARLFGELVCVKEECCYYALPESGGCRKCGLPRAGAHGDAGVQGAQPEAGGPAACGAGS